MEPSNKFKLNTSTKFVPRQCYGDMREVDPELNGGFEIKCTSIQNLIIFVCLNEVFSKIILYVNAPQILK